MVARRVCSVLLVLGASLSCTVGAQQRVAPEAPQPCATTIPENVEPGVLASELLALLRTSETFRGQCSRIGADARVRVTIFVVNMLDAGRAETMIRRARTGAIRARVLVLFGGNYQELLAHEFEHVIEQMDGVNLRAEATDGRAWLLPSGAFETRRAFAAGVQVLHETETGRVRPAGLPLR
jgi:hypothetical protein